MQKISGVALAAVLAASGIAILKANAQEQNSTPPAAQPNQSAPSSGTGQTAQTPPGQSGNQDFGRGWGRRGGMSGMMAGGRRGANLSEADRKAFFEARLASIKAGLSLTEEQQKLWPAVESAVRDMVKQREEWRERVRKEGRPANPADRMKQAGEMMTARGAAMTKMADAAKPLYASLSDEQKRRLQMLMRGGMRQHAGRGMGFGMHQGMGGHGQRWQRGEGRGMRGEYRHRWQQHHGWGQPHGGRGMGHGSGPRMGQGDTDGPRMRHGWGRGEGHGMMGRRDGNDQRSYGEGRRWQQDMPGEGFGGNSGQSNDDWRRM